MPVADLRALLAPEVLAAIAAAPWRETTHVQAHAYILRDQAPVLYAAMQALIREHGYTRAFGRTRYRYANVSRFRYWLIPPVLNREPLLEAEP
jgi:hypothetical protein